MGNEQPFLQPTRQLRNLSVYPDVPLIFPSGQQGYE